MTPLQRLREWMADRRGSLKLPVRDGLRSAPAAISRAASSLTAPWRRSVASLTPSSSRLAALE